MSKEIKYKSNSLPSKQCKPADLLPRHKSIKPMIDSDSISSGEKEDNENLPNEEEECFICTESREFVSIGHCNHKVCYLCSLRMRSLYNDDKCPLCKTDLPYVYFTDKKDTTFEELEKQKDLQSDMVNNIKFNGDKCYETAIKCLRLECPEDNCSFLAEQWNSLKSHVVLSHNKVFCELCLVHKKVFCFEQILFTQDQLVHHYSCRGSCNYPHSDLEQDQGFRGHPICGFCQVHFYEKGQYFEHLRDFHEQCHICQRKKPNILHSDYYRDYETLEQHFYHEHFLCTFPECLERKFMVFETEQEMIYHHELSHLHQPHTPVPILHFDDLPPPMPLHPQFHPHYHLLPSQMHPLPMEQFTNYPMASQIVSSAINSPNPMMPNQLLNTNEQHSSTDTTPTSNFQSDNRPTRSGSPIIGWMGRAKI